MKRIKPIFLIIIILSSACNGSSIDGKAQEEHYHNTDSMHTSAPSKKVVFLADSTDLKDSSKRQVRGTKLDAVKSTANPLYKGDNSDTGK
jgi:hypothetical protein